MFYHFLYPLKDLWFGFNILKYITFRAAMAAITSFSICVLMGPYIIRQLRRINLTQYIRRNHVGPLFELHKHKEGTPTMGGVLIVFSLVLSSLIWNRLDNSYVILCIGSVIWLGIVGFIDDYIKILRKDSKGLKAIAKLSGQVALAIFVWWFVTKDPNISSQLYFPFFKKFALDLGVFYFFLIILVILGTSNAVNLTDGLDGLAVGCIIMIASVYAVFSYVAGNIKFSSYLHLFYLPGAGEMAVFCSAMGGAALGFLWFNCFPAEVFMGDTGALAIGGVLGVISILIKQELLLVIAGGIFVLEAASVLLQVFSFKVFHKRIFLMAPLHHHFQLNGLEENKITVRFWIAALLLAVFALATMKIR